MAGLHCVITSPEGLVFEGEAKSVIVPAIDGELGVFPRHAALVAMLGAGELRVDPASGGQKARFFVDGGFLQVYKDRVTVLATQVEPLKGLNRAAAEAKVKALESSPPPVKSGLEARDAWSEKLRSARRRVKLAAQVG